MELRLGKPRTPQNAKTPYLQKTRKSGGRASYALFDVDPVVRHQHETDVEQPKQKVGLA